jgi:hypothetical protein
MKKGIILCGSLLCLTIMLITPSIPAMEYKTFKEKVQSDSYIKLEGALKNLKELKDQVKNSNINNTLLITILIKGILLPILLYTLSEIISIKVMEVYPILGLIILIIWNYVIPQLTIFSVEDMILEQTGNVLLSAIVSLLLGIFDNYIASRLAFHILYP